MVRIAICDDEVSFTSQLEELLTTYFNSDTIKISVDIFFDGKTLIDKIADGDYYDLVFMDIEMKMVDGITVAKKIRENDKLMLICFTSAHDEYLKDVFEVEPFRFLSKPIQPDKLQDCCRAAVQKMDNRKDVFAYQDNECTKRVLLKDIVFIESSGRVVKIHLKNGKVESFYGKLNKVEKDISKFDDNYIRIHQSFLINYLYVRRMTYSEIALVDNKKEVVLKISGGRKSFVRRKICEITGGVVIND